MDTFRSSTDCIFPCEPDKVPRVGDPVMIDPAGFATRHPGAPASAAPKFEVGASQRGYARLVLPVGHVVEAFGRCERYETPHVVVTYLGGISQAVDLADALRARSAWSSVRWQKPDGDGDGGFRVFIGRGRESGLGPRFGEAVCPDIVVAYLHALWRFDVEPKEPKRGAELVLGGAS